MNEQNFSELFEQDRRQRDIREGGDLPVKVLDINENFVIVGGGLKSESNIAREEFTNDNGELEVDIGDFVDVEVELLEDGTGKTILSRQNFRRKHVWKRIDDAVANDGTVEGRILSRVRGGYSVNVLPGGVSAFLPASLASVFPVADPSSLIGEVKTFKPIKINRRRNSVVLNRRAVEEKEGAIGADIVEGARIKGIVRTVTEYGAFVEVSPGLHGLLHITDLAWRHVTDVNETVQPGQEIEVKILRIDTEKGRISLGMKQLTPDPWEDLARAHPIGSRTFGTVTEVKEYGAFVDIGNGVQGLVHSSQMAWTRKSVTPANSVSIGDEVEVMVLDIDPERRRISLSIKQCAPNPWKDFETAYRKGDRVKGVITAVNEYGLFVQLPGGEIDGMVRMSDLSYDEPAAEAVKKYKPGQEIETVLLGVEVERERVALGVKQMDDGAMEDFAANNPEGARVTGTVVQVVEKGAVVRLMPSVQGFLPAGEIAEERVEKVSDYVSVGDEREFMLLEIDPTKRRLILSLKNREGREKRGARGEKTAAARAAAAATAAPRKPRAPRGVGATLGAVLQSALKRAQPSGEGAGDEGAGESESAAKTEGKAETKSKAAKGEVAESEDESAGGKSTEAKSTEAKAAESESAEAKSAESESESESVEGDADEGKKTARKRAAKKPAAKKKAAGKDSDDSESESESASGGESDSESEAEAGSDKS